SIAASNRMLGQASASNRISEQNSRRPRFVVSRVDLRRYRKPSGKSDDNIQLLGSSNRLQGLKVPRALLPLSGPCRGPPEIARERAQCRFGGSQGNCRLRFLSRASQSATGRLPPIAAFAPQSLLRSMLSHLHGYYFGKVCFPGNSQLSIHPHN